MKAIKAIIAVLTVFVTATFTIYYLNLDMKLIRKVYDLMGKHYDEMDKKNKGL